jgi:ABC-type nitrate/sulfonate/bicarbonate transport system permease component
VSARRLLQAAGPPAVVGVVFVALWELLVRGLDLKPYFLAAPSKIVAKLGDNVANVWDAVVVSGTWSAPWSGCW